MAIATIKPCVVYALVERGTSEIRYVGQTRSALWKRLADHVAKGSPTDPRPVLNWIAEVYDRGSAVEIVALQSDAAWNADERRWIAKLVEEGADLLNVEHCAGRKGELVRAVYAREGAREYHRARTLEAMTASTRANMSRAGKGKPKSPEHNAKVSAAIREMAAKPEHAERLKRFGERNAHNQTRLDRSAATHRTPEHRAEKSARMKKIAEDPEFRRKISAALRASWAKRKAAQ